MHSMMVKAIPAASLCPLAVSRQILLSVIRCIVVFSWNVEHLFRFAPCRSWPSVSNSAGLAKWVKSPVWIRKSGVVGNVLISWIAACKSGVHIRIRRLVESNVAVADLHKLKSVMAARLAQQL